MSKFSIPYRFPLLIAVLLHALLIVLLMTKVSAHHYLTKATAAPNAPTLVHAAVVDQAQIDAQIQRIKQSEAIKRQAEVARVARLQHQALVATQSRQRAQKQLYAMRRLQSALEAKQRAKTKALAAYIAHQKQAAHRADVKARQARAHFRKMKTRELKATQKSLQQQLLAQQLSREKARLEKVHRIAVDGLVNQYRARILQAIRNNWHPKTQNSHVFSQFLVHVAPGGVVTRVDLLQGSGDASLDRSARLAVYKSSPLPVPKDATLFRQFRQFRIKMSPQDVLATKNQAF
jgi:colicin import membrane protein